MKAAVPGSILDQTAMAHARGRSCAGLLHVKLASEVGTPKCRTAGRHTAIGCCRRLAVPISDRSGVMALHNQHPGVMRDSRQGRRRV